MFGRQIIRTFTKSAVRRSEHHHDTGGVPGANLPFPIHNRYLLTAIFTIYFGSAFAIPFLMVRHQLKK